MATKQRQRAHRTNIPGLYRVDASRVFPEGGWEVRYRDDLNHTRRRRFRTKQEALDYQAAVRTDKRRGDFIDPVLARTPLRNVAERWYLTTEGLSPATRAAYRSNLDNHVLPKLGDRAVSKITPSDIKAMLATSGLALKTQSNILRVLSPMLNVAIDDGMIRTNPCARVKLAPKPVATRTYLTAEQILLLGEEIHSRFRTLVFFAAYTGMRAGEIVALRVRSLDLLRGRVSVEASATDVRGHIHFGPPKNGRARTIAMPRFLVESLAPKLESKTPDDFVFESPGGGILRHGNFYARFFKPALARIGLPHTPHRKPDPNECALCGEVPDHTVHTRTPFRFHDLRHTAASLLIAQGVHPKAVSEHLGHSSIAVTMDLYGHLYPDYEEVITTALEDTYRGITAEAADGSAVIALH